MHWSRPLSDLPEEMTAIWSCTKEGCKGWMRDGFSFHEVPICPQCKSTMISSQKVLPILVSSHQQMKNYRKSPRTTS